ncbi:MAG: hydroxymethylglutaryl-CoA lyase [Daejeonella sp.]|uniref:hydroxymethylglutaryl-CoA lyase n=1 Tax=Daejeonella sp. JGW-45 TaxID=3034148 RepID=UPI0023EBD3CC|nr:hydroxymethylglutaryl-CoA lyase [Daejeonella sp. JGW-45]
MIKLTECPRDAMQGLHDYIPAKTKAEYINLLLKVGFDTIDFGSFVSPKAVPQMKDTEEVLQMLDLSSTDSRLLAIVANLKGVEQAIKHTQISYLGFPFSISETFQQRNTNSGIEQSLETVRRLLDACETSNKEAVIYLSMAFGNPYGDEWNNEIAEHWTYELVKAGAKIISLADTTGVSTPESISYLFPHLQSQFPNIEFGVHLHSTPDQTKEKLEAALNSGCKRFDSALKGYGGCPMAADTLTGNIATEELILLLEERHEAANLDKEKWSEALIFSSRIFS